MIFSAFRVKLLGYFGLIGLTVGLGFLLTSSAGTPPVVRREPPSGSALSRPSLSSQAIVVIDVPTGQILLGMRAYAKMHPGPLIQMLTALQAVEQRNMDELVLVSHRAASQPGPRIGLTRGSEVPLGTLISAFWFTGAGDAGMALIEHVAGSDAAFIRQTQEYADRLGAVETVLVSAIRPDDPIHSTTPLDLALVARAVLSHSTLGPLASRRRVSLEWNDVRRELLNINSFLWRYPGATGVKSGFTEEAGYVAAASAKRGSRHIVAVVLGAPSSADRWADLTRYLDYAFRHHSVLIETPVTEALPYSVAPGDTLLAISLKTGVDPSVIAAWNDLNDPDRLPVGMRLWIPVAEGE